MQLYDYEVARITRGTPENLFEFVVSAVIRRSRHYRKVPAAAPGFVRSRYRSAAENGLKLDRTIPDGNLRIKFDNKAEALKWLADNPL